MLPSLAGLSLHGGADTGPKAAKPAKDPAEKKTPYFKKSKDWDSSPAQRDYMVKHWQDDTWKRDLDPPETPAPPPDRKFWNRVPLKAGQKGFVESEASELKRAKQVAAKMHPATATSPR